MCRRIFILFILFSQLSVAQEHNILVWPLVNNDTRPWTRLWWPGGIATERDITAALEKYHLAGLGGIEITNLYGVRGQEDKFTDFLSKAWMDKLSWFLSESSRINLSTDLANAPSWPFGGPWVKPDMAAKHVAYKSWQLREGEKLAEKIVYIEEPFVRWSGTYRTDIKNIKDPVYNNSNLQELSIDQIRFEKPLPVILVMAYSDKGQAINLTQKVDGDGILDWVAPQGNWTLYAVFQGWHGKMVERAGPGGEGYVIDHFSDKALKNYLAKFDEAFREYDLKSLRGFYNDSYEVDDARGQADWTPELFSEFLERRGYDLREYLPALFQKDDPEKNLRVLCDYRQTISDLILEKFTQGWASWAKSKGKIIRNQSHGSPGNILDLYAASDIPETEGTDILRCKFATSAANVSGKRLVSSEAATWLGEHFSSTLLDIRKNVDQYFIAGVNHIAYHGTCFSPINEPWPGFQFYASVEFSPANSIWYDLPVLNTYVTRVQSFLQDAKPDNDILLYFPIFDRFSDFNGQLLEHFDGISPRFNGTNFRNGAELMNKQGYAFDYISDLQVAGIMVEESKLYTGGVAYQTLVLPHCNYIPVETFNRIVNLADKGATIIFYGEMPDDISGWKNLEDNREIYTFLKEQIKFTMTGKDSISVASFGKGKIYMGTNLARLLEAAGIRRESLVDQGLSFNRRKVYSGNYYFILNTAEKPFNGWVTLESGSRSAAVFDAMTGLKGMARTRASDTKTEVYIRLNPAQSVIVRTDRKKQAGEPFIYYDPSGDGIQISGEWGLKFLEGGPVLPPPIKVPDLKSWTELGGDDFKNFSGTAEYEISFPKPSGKAHGWLLNLGKIYESARIYLNNSEIAKLIGPDYQVFIPKYLLKSENRLVVRVTNLSANRIAYLDRNNINWKKFYNTNYPSRLPQNRKNGLFDASAWPPRESGLTGPVTLTPVKIVK